MRTLCLMSLIVAAVLAADEKAEHFEMKVRPLLAKNCYACHTQAALGGLRLDSREALLKGGKSGAAIVVGQPEESLLLKAVRHSDERVKQMPPTGKLSPDDIALLAAWVKDGAVFPARSSTPSASKEYQISPEQRAFWSFQSVRKPAPPLVKDTKWARNEIDRFIQARLEKEGIVRARAADRRTLLRRLSFDLIGLPPTPAEMQTFLEDKAPNAWEKQVDRLLASPHYGERWGRYWLDVARYADDKLNSTQDEPYANSFRYRNWVIDALNRDLPYDQFVKAQIAGDLMPSDDANRFAAGTGFFALSPEMQDERVDALTKGFLGLTVACAQCHDHKFDPIPTKDFYSLQGILNSSQLHDLPLAPKDVVEHFAAQKKNLDAAEARLKSYYERQTQLLGESLAGQTARFLLATQGLEETKGLDEETLKRWTKYLASDRLYHPYLDTFRNLVKSGAGAEALRKEAERFQAFVIQVNEEKKDVDDKNHLILGQDPTRNDLSQTQLHAMDRDKTVLWRDLFERSISDAGGAFKYGSGVLYHGRGTIERFLGTAFQAHIDAEKKSVEAMKKAMPPQYPFLQTLKDKDKPADMKVWIRGDRNNQGDVAPRRFLAILGDGERKPFSKGSGRLELAEAIASPANPLTARVMVNRIWQGHFGQGIVATPSNFGQLGERPTHPELLDYLAAYFVENGQSVKKLHKLIAMSATYSLAAENIAANENKDPDNRYYWRARRRRVDAETLRDSLLFASGQLDLKPAEQALKLDDEKNTKRTVYGFISRRKVDGMLALFDFPNPQATSEARMATNVPLQRLYLMNSPFVEAQAKALAGRLNGENPAKIRQAYQILYSREPDATELQLGLEFLQSGDWTMYARALLGSNEFLFVN
jgi:hypothetical protein